MLDSYYNNQTTARLLKLINVVNKRQLERDQKQPLQLIKFTV